VSNDVLKHDGVNWVAGRIVNANVDAAAAIAGSKVTPNFGVQALTAGTTNVGTLGAGASTLASLRVTNLAGNPSDTPVIVDVNGDVARYVSGLIVKQIDIPIFSGVESESLGSWKRVASYPWPGVNAYAYPGVGGVDIIAIGEITNVLANCEIRLWDVDNAVVLGTVMTVANTLPTIVSQIGVAMNSATTIEVQVRTSNNAYTATISSMILRLAL
jgi:hypothetical protein